MWLARAKPLPVSQPASSSQGSQPADRFAGRVAQGTDRMFMAWSTAATSGSLRPESTFRIAPSGCASTPRLPQQCATARNPERRRLDRAVPGAARKAMLAKGCRRSGSVRSPAATAWQRFCLLSVGRATASCGEAWPTALFKSGSSASVLLHSSQPSLRIKGQANTTQRRVLPRPMPDRCTEPTIRAVPSAPYIASSIAPRQHQCRIERKRPMRPGSKRLPRPVAGRNRHRTFRPAHAGHDK